jgi:adenosylmethionine-8-amino-7-oxononanoate aminotransferase
VADGVDGDTILLGPPFVVTDDELIRIADVVAESVDAATGRPEMTQPAGRPGRP